MSYDNDGDDDSIGVCDNCGLWFRDACGDFCSDTCRWNFEDREAAKGEAEAE
jgi:hypothetical protein